MDVKTVEWVHFACTRNHDARKALTLFFRGLLCAAASCGEVSLGGTNLLEERYLDIWVATQGRRKVQGRILFLLLKAASHPCSEGCTHAQFGKICCTLCKAAGALLALPCLIDLPFKTWSISSCHVQNDRNQWSLPNTHPVIPDIPPFNTGPIPRLAMIMYGMVPQYLWLELFGGHLYPTYWCEGKTDQAAKM